MSRVFDDAPEPEPRPEPPEYHLHPAGPGLVLGTLVAGLLLGGLVVSAFRLFEVGLPVTPWTMSALLILVGGAAALGSVWLNRRLHDPRRRPDFVVPVGALVLGRSMLVTGLLVTGGHIAYVIAQLGRLHVTLYRERAIAGIGAVVAGVVFSVGGYLLERACRVHPDEDEESQP